MKKISSMNDETGSGLQQQSVSRRTLLKIGGAGAGALVLGGAGALALESVLSPLPVQAASTFLKGADVSWLPQMEANGYIFKNASGVQEDLLTILKGYGVNAISLRTWVNPSSDPVNGHCSMDETVAMAVRCKTAGLPVDISFHFGDTWNSVGTQNPPAAWASMTYSEMLPTLSTYVYHFMNVMKYNKVTPGWVTIGNEINSGICHPVGSLAHYPAQMTGLLNGAYAAVKDVYPSVPVEIHLGQPQNLSVVENFFDTYKSYGGNWDISAFSSYGSGSSTIAGIIADMNTIQSRYGKPIKQVEFGGAYNRAARTETDMESYITGLKSIGGLGLYYWEPECYSPFTTYTMGAWDPTTKEPTVALNAFLNA